MEDKSLILDRKGQDRLQMSIPYFFPFLGLKQSVTQFYIPFQPYFVDYILYCESHTNGSLFVLICWSILKEDTVESLRWAEVC